MMVSGDEAYFMRGSGEQCHNVFGMYKTLLVYDVMVDVDFGDNRRHVGWGKGSISSLFDNYE